MGSEVGLVEEFMEGPLVAWIRTFEIDGGRDLSYAALADGAFLYDVMMHIDPRGGVDCGKNVNRKPEDSQSRLSNLTCVLHLVKSFYQDILDQPILLPLPDVVVLSKTGETSPGVRELRKLLLLVLGCAVQSPLKENVVENIKKLDLRTQHSIVQCIQEVTDNPEAVWPSEWMQLDMVPKEQMSHAFELLVAHCLRLAQERNFYNEGLLRTLCGDVTSDAEDSDEGESVQHLGVQMADLKAQLRRLRQDNEEKSESVSELKEELEQNKSLATKLRQENIELIQDARAARAWRDEADILRERASKVDTLESEISRFKDKMADIEFYKSRVEELREDNRILVETKEMLEDQLASSRRRAEQILELENTILQLKQTVNQLSIEKDTDRDRLQELMEENAQLQMSNKHSLGESANLVAQLDFLKSKASNTNGISLGTDILGDAQTKVLKLQLENQRLEAELEETKREALIASSDKILDLEKENKRLSLKVLSLQETSQKEKSSMLFMQQELEQRLQEAVSIQDTVDATKPNLDKLSKDTQDESSSQLLEVAENGERPKKMVNDMRYLDVLSANIEVQRLQKSLDTLSKKYQTMEKDKVEVDSENVKLQRTVETLKLSTKKLNEFERDLTEMEGTNDRLERENKSLHKEVTRLKGAIEVKDKLVDETTAKISTLERTTKKLTKEVEELRDCDNKLRELEQEKRELQQQIQVEKKTLSALREDLVSEKVKTQQLANQLGSLTSDLARLGLNHENLSAPISEADNEFKVLEAMLEDTMKRSIELREEKIVTLESRLSESVSRNQELRKQLLDLRGDYESLLQRQQEEGDHLTVDAVKEIAKHRELLKRANEEKNDIENEVASLTSQNNSYREQVCALQSQVTSLSNQNTVMSQHNATLQGENARLQVENTTLQSQSASLIAHNSSLQTNATQIEIDRDKARRSLTERDARLNQLLSDNEALQKLHEQLTKEYESLKSENNNVKASNKNLKQELKNLQEKHQSLTEGEEDLLKLQEALELERTMLQKETNSLSNLRAEHSRLKDDFRCLFSANEKLRAEYKNLQGDYKSIKTESNSLKLKLTEMNGEFNEARDQIATLDVEVSKLNNKCQVFESMNSALEEDRRSLMSQVSLLLSQYHDLLTQTLEDKQHFHQEEKNFVDKVNNLRRQKEKLEEKIMEQYRRMDNSPHKKLSPGCVPYSKGFGSTLVRKVRKAGNDLMNKVPRSGRSRSRNREDGDSPDSSSLGSSSQTNDSSLDSGSETRRSSPNIPPSLPCNVEGEVKPTDGTNRKSFPPSISELFLSGCIRESLSSEEFISLKSEESCDGSRDDDGLSNVTVNGTGELGRVGSRRPLCITEEQDSAARSIQNRSRTVAGTNGVAVSRKYSSTPTKDEDTKSTPKLPPRATDSSTNTAPQVPPRTRRPASTESSQSLAFEAKPKSDLDTPTKTTKDLVDNSIWYEYGCV